MIEITSTAIEEVVHIRPKIFEDERGFFLETYTKEHYLQAGINHDFVQDNMVGSRRGVLRGLHYQLQMAQGKLIQVLSGEIFDVAVDIRKSSPTFGQWVGIKLTAAKKNQLWIPAGFAHGYLVLSEWSLVMYKVTNYYDPRSERTILWNDPDIGIAWPLDDTAPILSAKDADGALFENAQVYMNQLPSEEKRGGK